MFFSRQRTTGPLEVTTGRPEVAGEDSTEGIEDFDEGEEAETEGTEDFHEGQEQEFQVILSLLFALDQAIL